MLVSCEDLVFGVYLNSQLYTRTSSGINFELQAYSYAAKDIRQSQKVASLDQYTGHVRCKIKLRICGLKRNLTHKHVCLKSVFYFVFCLFVCFFAPSWCSSPRLYLRKTALFKFAAVYAAAKMLRHQTSVHTTYKLQKKT